MITMVSVWSKNIFILLASLLLITSPNFSIASSDTRNETSNIVKNEQKAQSPVSLAFMNSLVYPKSTLNKYKELDWNTPEYLPFMTKVEPVFQGDELAYKWMDPTQRVKIEEVFKKFYHAKGFNGDNIFIKLLSVLQEKGINAIVPRYKIQDKSGEEPSGRYGVTSYVYKKVAEPEMTLMEKNKYPVVAIVKSYKAVLYHDGKISHGLIGTGLGAWTFDGTLRMETSIIIDIINSRTNELIDKIELNKSYQSSNTVAIVINNMVVGMDYKSDTRQEALAKLLDDYYKDLTESLINYNWQAAVDLLKK